MIQYQAIYEPMFLQSSVLIEHQTILEPKV